MKRIPENLEKQILGFSGVLFFILTFGIGPTNIFGLEQLLLNQTGYFFGVSLYYFDYALLSLIPFFALKLNAKRPAFRWSYWIGDLLILLFWTMISFAIGLYLLTFIGKPANPLMPQYLLAEPVFFYSVFFIGLGMGTPFLFRKGTVERNDNRTDDINV